MANPATTAATRSAGKLKLTKAIPISDTLAAHAAVAADQRHSMIAVAAYYIAQHRGFEAGHELEDWLRAESQIESALRGDTAARS